MPLNANPSGRRLVVAASLLTLCLLQWPSSSVAEIRHQRWFIPTRLNTRIPCLDKQLLKPGRSMDQEHSGASLYRWVQSDGNIVGSGFYQTVRLLRMPANHSEPFYEVHLECMVFDWATDSSVTSAHDINFYEGPTLTSSVSLSFLYRKNYTDFVDYLGHRNFLRSWCFESPVCIQAVIAPVRGPELEYPHLFQSAAEFNKTPLTDSLVKYRMAYVTGEANDYLFHVNFVIRMSLSSALEDLCDPRLVYCAQRLLQGRQAELLKFSKASVQMLDDFAAERATARKLRKKDQNYLDERMDAMNYSLRIYSTSLCPAGYGPANMSSLGISQSFEHNGTALLCLACPPGTHGTNGLNCFEVPNDYYTHGWGQKEGSPCPDYFVTLNAGAADKNNCSFNGTLPEMLVMNAMRLAWTEIEDVFSGSHPGIVALVLVVYLFFSAYALFWQLHRLITLMQYKARRSMSDRLLKRFIAEAYLRDIRRLQYWRATIDAAKIKGQTAALGQALKID